MKGRLTYIGQKRLGLELVHHYKCNDCGDLYPAAGDGFNGKSSKPSCNGREIDVCPYCAGPIVVSHEVYRQLATGPSVHGIYWRDDLKLYCQEREVVPGIFPDRPDMKLGVRV